MDEILKWVPLCNLVITILFVSLLKRLDKIDRKLEKHAVRLAKIETRCDIMHGSSTLVEPPSYESD